MPIQKYPKFHNNTIMKHSEATPSAPLEVLDDKENVIPGRSTQKRNLLDRMPLSPCRNNTIIAPKPIQQKKYQDENVRKTSLQALTKVYKSTSKPSFCESYKGEETVYNSSESSHDDGEEEEIEEYLGKTCEGGFYDEEEEESEEVVHNVSDKRFCKSFYHDIDDESSHYIDNESSYYVDEEEEHEETENSASEFCLSKRYCQYADDGEEEGSEEYLTRLYEEGYYADSDDDSIKTTSLLV